MAELRVTPETLNSQGQELIGYAEQLSEILTLINNKMTEIDEGWDGLAQNAYTNMYQTMNESLVKFPELVDSLGQATVAAAEAFATVDQELQSSFNSAQ